MCWLTCEARMIDHQLALSRDESMQRPSPLLPSSTRRVDCAKNQVSTATLG